MHRNYFRISVVLLTALLLCRLTNADEPAPKPLTPVEARKKVGEQIVMEMTVKKSKDRLENRGEIYLDSELDFRDAKNFATVINRDGAIGFQNQGVKDFEEHFRGKTIRVKGTVTVVDDAPRIEVSDSAQIENIEKK
ncbi:MAG TPA: hypothetical protein VGI40_09710 [Pirellulaceae bacterium]|jgi:hypothetical protein